MAYAETNPSQIQQYIPGRLKPVLTTSSSDVDGNIFDVKEWAFGQHKLSRLLELGVLAR